MSGHVLPGGSDWAVTADEVEAIRAHLDRHFHGGTVRALTELTDPGQLFQVVDREGSRFTLKILREAFDELRRRGTPLDEFLARRGIAVRLRRSGRVVVRGARAEDQIREERP
jgi:hypothetical protein